MVIVSMRSKDVVPHEVQKLCGIQGLLVLRKTTASHPSVTAVAQPVWRGGGERNEWWCVCEGWVFGSLGLRRQNHSD